MKKINTNYRKKHFLTLFCEFKKIELLNNVQLLHSFFNF